MNCIATRSFLVGYKDIYDVQALDADVGLVDIRLQVHQAAWLGARYDVGPCDLCRFHFAACKAVGNRGEVVGKQASQTAADIVLRHFHKSCLPNIAKQTSRLVVQSRPVGMSQAAIVALRSAVVHYRDRVLKRSVRRIMQHVDQKVAQIEALVYHLPIAVVERRVVEQLPEMLLDVHDTSTAERNHILAVVIQLYQFLAQCFGGILVPLVVEFLAAARQFVRIVAFYAESFEQADGLEGTSGCKLVNTAGHKNANFCYLLVHTSVKILERSIFDFITQQVADYYVESVTRMQKGDSA